MYTPLETFEGTLQSDTMIVLEPERTAVLTGLQEFVSYSISVRAYTSAGPGPYSVAMTETTSEDGEVVCLTFFFQYETCNLHTR